MEDLSSEEFPLSAEEVMQVIYDAFRGVDRKGGVSWADSEIIDNYGGDASFRNREINWEQLVNDPEWETDPGIGGFNFLDAIGFRYYLPAAMIRCIKTGDGSEIFLHLTLRERFEDFSLDQWSRLNERQALAIKLFLQYMLFVSKVPADECWMRWGDPKDWEAALNSYWINLVPRSPKKKTRKKVRKIRRRM